MRVAVSADEGRLDGSANHRFGRCPMFVFVDTDSMEFEATANPAAEAPGGAGIEAAQFISSSGVDAVITGRVGPNAMEVLEAAGMPVFLFEGGTVRQVVEQFKAGGLERSADEAVRGRGMGGGQGRGMGGGQGRGMGGGQGRGMGGGQGRGMGGGQGRGMGGGRGGGRGRGGR
jgi:predicted Fe-Mo cluster-binding NifX family protein